MFPRTFRQPKNDAYSVHSNITKTMGRHFMKAGGEDRAYQFYRQDEDNSNSTFGFENDFTRRDPLSDTGVASGNTLATFLLGLPTSGNVTLGTPRTEQYRYYALYLQDDWKLGLAHDIEPGSAVGLPAARDRQGRPDGLGFDFDAVNPLQSQLPQGANDDQSGDRATDALRGGLLFANHGGPEVPVQERLEQHPAAHRPHLIGSPSG